MCLYSLGAPDFEKVTSTHNHIDVKLPFFKSRSWSISNLKPPWGDRKSIYWHIANHIEEDRLGLTEGGEDLPDEQIVRGDSQFGWMAGAMDGALGFRAEGENAEQNLAALYDAIVRLTEESSDRYLELLYELVTSGSALSIVDMLLQKIADDLPTHHDRLHTLARWLAMESADREVVKLAISILGLFRDEHDLDLLMTLGRHEEFTLFVAVALQNSEVDVDNRLWKLAQHVRGWGRINIVERLAETDDDYIKDWLLREGYRNDVMYEYTALICARTGELHRRLKEGKNDDELIESAGAILTAVLAGSGPAEGYEVYEQGAETFETYLRILSERDNGLDALVFADRMERFLKEPENTRELSDGIRQSWELRRNGMLDSASRIKDQHGWEEKTHEALLSTDRLQFWTATEAAQVLGIDAWPHFFTRIKNGEDCWWNALQTDDVERIDALIKYAEETIPLEKIATGPSDKLGLGPEFAEHSKLDWLLQELRRFPGKGMVLIQTGLRSPVVRNRNLAVRALAEIPREDRTEEVTQLLADAHKIEPDVEARKWMESAMKGEPPVN